MDPSMCPCGNYKWELPLKENESETGEFCIVCDASKIDPIILKKIQRSQSRPTNQYDSNPEPIICVCGKVMFWLRSQGGFHSGLAGEAYTPMEDAPMEAYCLLCDKDLVASSHHLT